MWLALILAGGTVGTAVRAWLEGAYAPPPGEWPWVTLGINLGGALLLGALLATLAATGEDAGWRRGVRLGLGTGLLGGFTTYSTFSVETMELLRSSLIVGVAYALTTVAAGFVVALGAAWTVGRLAARRTRQ